MSDADSAGSGSDDGQKPKKTKIDLKSRLSSVRATGTMAAVPRDSADPLSFPPPPVMGSVPPPKMLSQAGASFVPPSPVSSAFAPPPPPVEVPKPTVQQQTIKIEENEILEERQRAAKKSRTYIALAVVASLAAAFPIGLVYERGAQGRMAVKGATELSKDVKASVDQMKEFSDRLLKAQEGFGNEQFPSELGEFVRQNKIPFDASKFEGRGVGAMPKELFVQLIKFSQSVEDLNKKIDRLAGQLNNPKVKDAVVKYWTQKKEPVVNFSIFLDKRGDDYFALLVPNKAPFPQKGAPPAKYTVIKPPSGNEKEGKDVEGKRLAASVKLEDGNIIVPVDESSVSRLTSQQAVAQLGVAIGETRMLMETASSADDSGDSGPGLIKMGEDIATALGKIGR